MADKKITLPVTNFAGEKVGDVKVSAEIFGLAETNEQVVHDAVVVNLANSRQATAKTKKRHEVRGGGKKPWRQKGTGRARVGSRRSPLWVGGGKVFGPDGNQNYKMAQNKKAHALAMKTVLSQKVADKEIHVIEALEVKEISTKGLLNDLGGLKLEGKILLVSADEKVVASATNIDGLKVRPVGNISVYDLLGVNNVVISKEDLVALEGGLK